MFFFNRYGIAVKNTTTFPASKIVLMNCVLNIQSFELLVLPLCNIDRVGEDVKVLRRVCQGLFYLHAVVIGIGEDAVPRYIFYRRPLLQRCLLCINLAVPHLIEQARLHSTCTSFPFIVSIIRKSVGFL